MSFVYAKKLKDTVCIFSDTKISNRNKTRRPDEDIIKNYGAMKCYIVNPHCVVGFAGAILYADELLEELWKVTDIQKIPMLCWEKHMGVNKETDFLIAYYLNDVLSLFQVKDGKLKNVQYAWVGSEIAFNKLENNTERLATLCVTWVDNEQFASDESVEEYNALLDKFYNAVYMCNDDGVGNFIIPLIFNNKTKRFEYRAYSKNQPRITYKPTAIVGNKVQLISSNLIGQSGANGDYTITVYGSHLNNVVMYVSEGSLVINFTMGLNSKYKNLCVPEIQRMRIYELEDRMKNYSFTYPVMRPDGQRLLLGDILHNYSKAKGLISVDKTKAERHIKYAIQLLQLGTKNYQFHENEINLLDDFIKFANTTRWSFKCEIETIPIKKS